MVKVHSDQQTPEISLCFDSKFPIINKRKKKKDQQRRKESSPSKTQDLV